MAATRPASWLRINNTFASIPAGRIPAFSSSLRFVYLFCKQFQHFSPLSASPPALFHGFCLCVHYPVYIPMHAAGVLALLMSFSICSMIRKQIDSHSIPRRFASDNFDFYWFSFSLTSLAPSPSTAYGYGIYPSLSRRAILSDRVLWHSPPRYVCAKI